MSLEELSTSMRIGRPKKGLARKDEFSAQSLLFGRLLTAKPSRADAIAHFSGLYLAPSGYPCAGEAFTSCERGEQL